VCHYALSIAQFLLDRGAQMLVFACNTSSALALELARERFAVPVIGTIEPGATAALQAPHNGRVGVLATRATVHSGVYSCWLRQLCPDVAVTEVACPDFVPLVEREATDSPAALEAARRYLKLLQMARVDTVVLGCTHYPLLLQALRTAAPELTFVDPAAAVAAAVADAAQELTGCYEGSAGDAFFASGESAGVSRWIGKLLGRRATSVQQGPVFELEASPAATS
jgi:glutamate racemase